MIELKLLYFSVVGSHTIFYDENRLERSLFSEQAKKQTSRSVFSVFFLFVLRDSFLVSYLDLESLSGGETKEMVKGRQATAKLTSHGSLPFGLSV